MWEVDTLVFFLSNGSNPLFFLTSLLSQKRRFFYIGLAFLTYVRIKYTVRNKCINHIILSGYQNMGRMILNTLMTVKRRYPLYCRNPLSKMD